MTIICSYCHKVMGTKPGEGDTHGVCPKCLEVQNRLLEEMIKEQQNVK